VTRFATKRGGDVGRTEASVECPSRRLKLRLSPGRTDRARMLYAQMATAPSGATIVAPGPSLEDETVALRPAVRAAVACVLGLGRDHADVEDCTNETLRRALEGSRRLRPGEALRPWLLGIARHVAIDHLRARRRLAQRVVQSPDADSNAPSILDTVADPAPLADDQLDEARQRARVRRAIESLADGPKRALWLVHAEGLGYQDVALRLGVPLGTVATWIARGRRSIADAMREETTNR